MSHDQVALRVGVLTDREDGHAGWELRLLDRLAADPRFELSALLVHPRPYGANRPSPLLNAVSRVDRKLFARQPPYRPQHLGGDTPGIRRIVLPDGPSPSRRALPELDIVLRMIPAPLPDALLADIPFGEWALSIADTRSDTADWSYIGAIAANAPLAEIQLTARRAGGQRPERIASAGFNVKFSAARSAAFVRERAVTLLMRELGRLADTRTAPATTPVAVGVVDDMPTTAEIGLYVSRLALAASARALKAIGRKAGLDTAVWTLYSGNGSIEDFEPRGAIEIPPSATSIRADPFLFSRGGERYIFYESYAQGEKKAHIAVGRLAEGTIEPIGVALESDTHLSFPFVFSEGDDIFMMPETHSARRIEIWRCVDFPLKWELHAIALEGSSAADTTLFSHDGRWWLLSNLSDGYAFVDHCSELHAFEVDGPKLSRVVAHARNPVVIGSAVARNAGRVFSSGGRLFRPSQNNSHGIYGYGLNIMEILRIDRDTYEERLVREIKPDFAKGLVGCHHFDAADGRYILDARLTA